MTPFLSTYFRTIQSIKIKEQGNVGQQQIDLQVGNVKIQSLPVAMTISIPGLNVNSSKTMDEWLAEDLPVGDYNATFTWSNKTLRYTIKVKHNQLTHLFVNLVKGDVEDRSSTSGSIQPNINYGTFKDERDGKIYKTIQIGNQIWMAENLNYYTSSGSWCYGNDETNCGKYGRLYNWETAKKVCPPGWHLPTKAEFESLKAEVNNDVNSLKAIGQGEGDGVGSNTSGFSALLAGNRNYNGNFYGLGFGADFWSSTENDATGAYNMYLDYNGSNINLNSYGKGYGFSVRCLKD